MKRREFLRTSVAVSTLAGLSTAGLTVSAAQGAGKPALLSPRAATAAEQPAAPCQEYYELRAYRLKSGANHDLLDAYLQKAAIPAWNRLGLKPIGVFTQKDRNESQAKTEVRDPAVVYVLIPYPSLEAFASADICLNADPEYQRAGAAYLGVPKDKPAFERIDSWLMRAFAGMPKIEQPAYSLEKKPRMFELRTYESYSEAKALKKVDMFNSGEMQVMRETGLAPVFYGQVLIGSSLPHLVYMLSAETPELHKQHFAAFGKHPTWAKMSKDPKYADTVSKIRNQFLVPTAYSQL